MIKDSSLNKIIKLTGFKNAPSSMNRLNKAIFERSHSNAVTFDKRSCRTFLILNNVQHVTYLIVACICCELIIVITIFTIQYCILSVDVFRPPHIYFCQFLKVCLQILHFMLNLQRIKCCWINWSTLLQHIYCLTAPPSGTQHNYTLMAIINHSPII